MRRLSIGSSIGFTTTIPVIFIFSTYMGGCPQKTIPHSFIHNHLSDFYVDNSLVFWYFFMVFLKEHRRLVY